MFNYLANYFFSLGLSFLVTLYLVPMLAAIARRLGMVDLPDGAIKQHKQATPYLGGVAVYVGFLSGLALTFSFDGRTISLLIGSTLLLFTGLIDDLLILKPYQKIFGQCLAALCFLKGGLFLKEQFFQEYWVVALPISLLWLLTLINAFNLVDVMDGLATTIALSVAGSISVIAYLFGESSVLLLLAPFIGSLCAFLYYNVPPASIYLGDAGALFVGGFLASVPFLLSWSAYNLQGYMTPVIIMGVPLFEVVALMGIRTYKGIPFYNPSRDHLHMYLQKNGWSTRAVLLLVACMSLLLLSIGTIFVLDCLSIITVIPLLFVAVALWIWIVYWPTKA